MADSRKKQTIQNSIRWSQVTEPCDLAHTVANVNPHNLAMALLLWVTR